MKNSLFQLFVVAIVALFAACGDKNARQTDDSGRPMSSGELVSGFQNPPPTFTPVPFWVWNGVISRPMIDQQLQQLHDQGYGGVFVHPRPGLISEYLSQEWFDLVKYTVEQAKKLGMQIWIYDENSFPSGFAGGHVPASMPESYNMGTGLKAKKTNELNPEDTTAILVYRKEGERYVNISSNWKSEAGKSADYLVFEKVFSTPSGMTAWYPYVDLLRKEVTQKFIEVTMTGYEKTIGPEFGASVPGVFTDEPNILAALPGKDRTVVRYTPALFEVFEQTWGYDLREHLPSLLEETGDWQRVRHNYWQTLLQLFIDNWSKPWYEYTEAKKLKWTGHYWEHGWPLPIHGSDNMAMYAWHQLPAIDMLFNNTKLRPDQFGNNRAVKEVASVANQFGRSRVLSETYGGSGWNISFADLKRNGDWQAALGVNLMNQHLIYQTIQGCRKYDFPQSFSYHTPWYAHYPVLNSYFTRLSYALSSGIQDNRILVLEPTTSAWMYYSPVASNPALETIGNRFNRFVDALEKAHIEYDLGCENIIKDQGKIEKAGFVVAQRTYDLVVLPPEMHNLDKTTFDLIAEYLKQGGRLISFVKSVDYVDGNKTPAVNQLLAKYSQVVTFAELPLQPVALKLLAPHGLVVNATASLPTGLYHQRRTLEDGQVLFFCNFNADTAISASVSLACKYLYALDLFDGKMYVYPSDKEGDMHTFDISLAPAGSLLLLGSDTQTSDAQPWLPPLSEGTVVNSSQPLRVVRNQPNVLVLEYCDVAFGNRSFKGISSLQASDSVFRHHGFKQGNPWAAAVQYKQTYVEKNNFPPASGYDAVYHFEAGAELTPEQLAGLKLVVEIPALCEVSVNNTVIEATPGEWWLDTQFGVYHIGKAVRHGKNQVRVSVHPMSVFAELEPVYILGDFALESASKGWKMTAPKPLSAGSWISQGLPFYGHTVSYKTSYTIHSPKGRYALVLPQWKGSVARIAVNGHHAGLIAWPPYSLDVTTWLQSGDNEVEVEVYGSLKNVLGPFHTHDTPGLVTPWSWRYYPPIQPAGNAYMLDVYGLLADMELRAVSLQ